MPSFKQFQFQPFINEALAEKGFEEPTEVQEKLIPIIKKGKSVIGQSQTGSGKTHTFLLPLMDKVKPTIDEVQIVITAPSRELANQIYQAAQQLARFSQPEIRVSNFVGGTDKQRQLNKLKHQMAAGSALGEPAGVNPLNATIWSCWIISAASSALIRFILYSLIRRD